MAVKAHVPTQLSNVDGIIANKQERAGGHGGWLRRCEIRDDAQVSFVVDEDFRDRGHIPEEVGHFAFEKNSEIPDICPYFPAPIATNSYFNGVPHSSQISLSGDRNKIFLNNRDPVSFNTVNLSANSGCVYDQSGSVENCNFDPQLSFPELPASLPQFQFGTEVVDCDDSCNRTIQPVVMIKLS
ncbi:MSHA biogenesis protein MshQ [Vibrio astriarenae]|nr:MSHA biogenesis protein MshQ [Vibrio sp. C7]